MPKTKPTCRETKFGILSMQEIEALITDSLFVVRSYIVRNYNGLIISIELIQDLHLKLASNLFKEAVEFRKKQVQLGDYEPPKYFKVPELMKNWEDDFMERKKFIKTLDDHIELLAWMMHRFLWIHPFFDYNGRAARLLGEIYLLTNNLPAASFMGVNRNEFAEAMKLATCKNDLSGVIRIIKRNLK
ncbi:Fic family protein [Patescibacteria group bacterium]|nr:Fic family protein [Candidatus Falkowbacteria bacterium]MBU3906390.1 Fic family protein [Patescibacteria group bacterium]MBU4014973.1 Fic family protein [Patescibacteria group bacterium]MBU4026429.1 Fic family protein [Patescibacteria group bacterium]MBU4072738.1 Fic family protein [Patescibacteria group bacterium]